MPDPLASTAVRILHGLLPLLFEVILFEPVKFLSEHGRNVPSLEASEQKLGKSNPSQNLQDRWCNTAAKSATLQMNVTRQSRQFAKQETNWREKPDSIFSSNNLLTRGGGQLQSKASGRRHESVLFLLLA